MLVVSGRLVVEGLPGDFVRRGTCDASEDAKVRVGCLIIPVGSISVLLLYHWLVSVVARGMYLLGVYIELLSVVEAGFRVTLFLFFDCREVMTLRGVAIVFGFKYANEVGYTDIGVLGRCPPERLLGINMYM
jgi:hypothetical protein